jgi:DNA modification methylase
VIAGNGTLEAAKQLGWTHINAVVTELDDLGKMAFALADNKTSDLSEFDDDILKEQLDWLDKQDFDIGDIGFMDYEIQDESKGNDGLTDPDDVPEVPQNVFGVKRGDVWILGNHRIMCGDSTDESDVAKLMNGKKANLMFTDPPYGVSYADKNAYLNTLSKGNRIQVGIKNDHMKPEEMNEFWIKFLTQAHNILLDNSSYYICSPQGGDLMMMMMMSIIHAGFQLKHMLIWVKNNHVLGRCDYNYKHEPILYGWKEKGTHKFYGNGKYKTSVWEFNKPLKNDLHPTMKPVELCEEAILNSSDKNNVVYEPFLGSGSTLIACEKTGRTCYGCELDEHYCSVIIKRYIDFVGTSDEVYLVENGEKIRLSEVQKMREIIC